MVFKSVSSFVWALRFLELPDNEPFPHVWTKKKYTRWNLMELLGIKRMNDEYNEGSFIADLIRCGALVEDGMMRQGVPYYVIDKDRAFSYFLEDPIFQDLAEMFKERVLAGDY